MGTQRRNAPGLPFRSFPSVGVGGRRTLSPLSPVRRRKEILPLRKGDFRGEPPWIVAVHTLGCRLNQYESDGLLTSLLASGLFRAAGKNESPHLFIVNSCSVTDQADARNRHLIRSHRRAHPHSAVVLTGCYAQTERGEGEALEGVDLVVGNDRKSSLAREILRLVALSSPHRSGADSLARILRSHGSRWKKAPPGSTGIRLPRPRLENPFDYGRVRPQGHVRAYLKIQEGCDRICTYCKVPLARGRGVSRPRDEIVEHFTSLMEEGVPEVILTGVNLGAYHDRERGMRLVGLVETLLETAHRGSPRGTKTRLRISSIEPGDVTEELARLTLDPLFCDFLHIPLQSGSDGILRAMKRPYRLAHFRRNLERILRINPHLHTGTDIMVGFPGEGETQFRETLELVREFSFAKIHIFPFSPRRGTPAASLENRPTPAQVKERMALLEEESRKGWIRYASRFLEQERTAVVERTGERTSALTDNYLRLEWESVSESALASQAGGLSREKAPPSRTPRRGALHPFRLIALDVDRRIVTARPL